MMMSDLNQYSTVHSITPPQKDIVIKSEFRIEIKLQQLKLSPPEVGAGETYNSMRWTGTHWYSAAVAAAGSKYGLKGETSKPASQ